MDNTKPEVPANIVEFNIIVGLIFAQLYEAFPVVVDLIDRDGIAKAMGVTGDWPSHKLAPSKITSVVSTTSAITVPSASPGITDAIME